ncbi:hypothetical protein VT52_021395 [Streptomyces malaysiense]|uniref:Uncharacterized protein n=1 Tax=Streptomyces malaysiense TaxID=1428626 RepID=A0A1J4PXC3_9ACTN|nr:hypothetical protein VT52_021395 [Streptomyces malaysiense]
MSECRGVGDARDREFSFRLVADGPGGLGEIVGLVPVWMVKASSAETGDGVAALAGLALAGLLAAPRCQATAVP